MLRVSGLCHRKFRSSKTGKEEEYGDVCVGSLLCSESVKLAKVRRCRSTEVVDVECTVFALDERVVKAEFVADTCRKGCGKAKRVCERVLEGRTSNGIMAPLSTTPGLV